MKSIEYQGKTMVEWSQETGIPRDTLYRRWHSGFRGKDLFSKNRLKKKIPIYEYHGEFLTAVQVAELEGCSKPHALKKIKAYRESLSDELVYDDQAEKELRGELPVSGLYAGCSQATIDALVTGDINSLMITT